MNPKDIFLSHSHRDVGLAQKVAALLEGHGFDVWWDEQLQAGEDYRVTIANRIRESRGVVVLFSEHSIHSGWVLDEAGRAHQQNKLIPVLVGNSEIPLGFGILHHCQLSLESAEPNSPEARALVAAVEQLIGKRSAQFSSSAYEAALAVKPAKSIEREGRFYVGWLPDKAVIGQLLTLAAVYLFALGIAFLMHPKDNFRALHEWLRLLHIYSGMIVLGGGIFLLSAMRISDALPTPQERVSAGDIIRPVLGSWRFAALAQLATGGLLTWLSGHTLLLAWLQDSTAIYICALYLWWFGFWHGLKAIESEALYRDRIVIGDFRRSRDLHLTLALVTTGWVLTLMVYKDDASVSRLIAKFSGLN